MAIVDLLVKSATSPQLSADNATVQHQVALLLHGDYTKCAWLSFSASRPKDVTHQPWLYSLAWTKWPELNDTTLRLNDTEQRYF